MNAAIDQLSTSILNKSLEECSEEELQSLARQYPWFAPAQLLYAKKLKAVNSSLYPEQLQKASLYFQNRLWLEYLLEDNRTEISGLLSTANQADTTPVIQEIPSVSETLPAISPVVVREEEVAAQQPAIAEPASEIVGETQADTNNDEIEQANIEEEIPEEKLTPEMRIEPEIAPQDETGNSESDEPATEPSGPELKIPGLKMEPINANAQLTFEPYHTVDYFASQGIRVREDEKPADRFGHQLKSFTEWLKTLKRLPAAEISQAVADPSSEKKVEQLAEHSLAERHVVTEAMAEVWIKQGNRARAEEIYRKLSLLEPSKTAYFAAKIEDLKKTS